MASHKQERIANASASVTLPKGGKASFQPSKLFTRTSGTVRQAHPDNVPMTPDGSPLLVTPVAAYQTILVVVFVWHGS